MKRLAQPLATVCQYVEFVPARWLAALAGLAMGLFLTRAGYELWPGQLSALVFWPTGPALALSIAALVTALYRFTSHAQRLTPLLPYLLLWLYVLQPAVHHWQALVLLAGAVTLSLIALLEIHAQEWLIRWGMRLLLGAALLAMYLPTMGRAVGQADTFEFQVVAPLLGVAHPTGYPLYILLGKLFSLLPLGPVAWRVNLTSTACAVLAVGLTGSALGVISHTSRPTSHALRFIASLALAASSVFWSQAIVAEVYTLNAAFVALWLWLALRGLGLETDRSARRWLLVLAASYGLSLTNHLTMLLCLPAVLLTLWWVRPRLSPRDGLKACGLFLLGLSLYGYILIRWPALHNGAWMPLTDFIGWITGRPFGGALQPALWRDPTRWHILGRLLLEAYGPIGTALATLGLGSLLVRARRAALITVLTFIPYCMYALVYNVPDISVFLIPAHLVMALWLGAGMLQISDFRPAIFDNRPTTDDQHPTTDNRHLFSKIWPVLLALLPLSLLWTNGPQVDQSRAGQDWMAWGRYVLSLPLPRQAAILADSEKIAPLYYLKSIEGVRRDLDLLVLGTEELYRAELERRVAQGQPVYLARFLPGLAGPYRLHSVGPLARVTTTPLLNLPPAPITQRLNVSFQATASSPTMLKLIGYNLTSGPNVHHLTLYWQAKSILTTNYHVRLRLVSENGIVWWEDPGTHPVGGLNPTVAWQPDEVVSDYHELAASNTMPPGRYRVQVGLFAPFSTEGLQTEATTGAVWYEVCQVDMNPTPATLPLALRANFGGQVLLRGVSAPGLIPPAGRGEVTLEWEKLAPTEDYMLQLTLVRADGVPVRTLRLAPYAGEYPLTRWETGRRMQMQVNLTAPEQPGLYTLRVGWVTASNQWVAARCRWMGQVAWECPIATLRVEGTRRETGLNFADLVLLVKWQINRETLRPGEALEVHLRWQGLKTWPADYTVFVHLLGPDGKLYGQVDAAPVQGTLPTLQWKEGQIVDDPYRVMLSPDAPAGEYQIEVGWYLLATMRRLSVLDAAGRPVDDRVIVGRVNVAP